MTVFDILNLRYEFEELVRKLRLPKEKKAGTYETMVWMINPKNHWSISTHINRDRILQICNEVVEDERTRTKFV